MNTSLAIAIYNGKTRRMDHIARNPDESAKQYRNRLFRLACQCVRDNAGDGYVVDNFEQLYRISRSSRVAKLVTGEEAAPILDSIQN